jgi:hypothetical protein
MQNYIQVKKMFNKKIKVFLENKNFKPNSTKDKEIQNYINLRKENLKIN